MGRLELGQEVGARLGMAMQEDELVALRSAAGDPFDPDNAQAITDAQDALDAPDVQAASDRIQDYFSERCPG